MKDGRRIPDVERNPVGATILLVLGTMFVALLLYAIATGLTCPTPDTGAIPF